MSALTRVNIALALAWVVTVALVAGGGRDYSQPNLEYMPDMARSLAFETYSSNPVFQNGITSQAAPVGTIARGHLPLDFGPGPEEAERAGRELIAPLDADAAGRARVYATFCRPCHGPTGRGDGAVVARGFPAPPPLGAPQTRGMPDGKLFHIVTFGQGNMPAHAAQMSVAERWLAVAQVRALQATESGPSQTEGR